MNKIVHVDTVSTNYKRRMTRKVKYSLLDEEQLLTTLCITFLCWMLLLFTMGYTHLLRCQFDIKYPDLQRDFKKLKSTSMDQATAKPASCRKKGSRAFALK